MPDVSAKRNDLKFASTDADVSRTAHRHEFDERFARTYAALNPDQRRAVETIEGPVMCVAGPGTGKTQVVALRVANILQRTQMGPGNILCLTFSNSGAAAMRERLRALIGPNAYGIRVLTIHAFAQSIIEDNASVFEAWSAREQISDLERVREMNKIIDQLLPHSELLNPKDPYSKNSDLIARISDVKREGKTQEDLHRVAEDYDREMASKSREGTKAHEKNLLAARKFRDFIKVFTAYQEMLDRTGRYDYDDMILHVIRALTEEDWLLQGLQEKYQYVLVDEFQDTNGAQYRLIELLTTYANVHHEPNLFVVGDDDQAIYRFQGANLMNMLSFHLRFPSAPVIPLVKSYRSTQPILDAARSLIECNEERLVGKIDGLEKNLTAATSESGAVPVFLHAASNTAEPWLIADLVAERIAQGVSPDEIAILTWKNDELFPMLDVLRARGIPVLITGKDDLLSHPFVRQAVTVLRALEETVGEDGRLAAALGCSCFHVHPVDLARLRHRARAEKTTFFAQLMDESLGTVVPLLDAQTLIRARDLLLDLRARVASRTALETVEYALRGCGFIAIADGNADADVDPKDLAALEAFFSYVRAHCLERRQCTLSDLLSDIRLYDDPAYAQVRLTYALPHLTTAGVRLMTAHQSKGLEFHTVILTNFRDGHWDRRVRRSGVALPEHLLFGWEKEQKQFEQHQDERRVAFVAMTRAKRELLFTCPREITVGQKARAVSPSGFLAQMRGVREEEGVLRDPARASLLLLQRAHPIDGALRGYIEERLKTFMLSATSLNRFLRDPREFLLVDLLEQPEEFDEGTIRRINYGKAVHWSLRQWAIARKEGRLATLEHFLDAFAWYLRERTILTDSQRSSLLGLGGDALPHYFAKRLQHSSPFLHAVEHEYKAYIDDVPVKGKIDRIDRLSDISSVATVIDYKAGKGKSESEIRGDAEEGGVSRVDNGDHFRQLVLYALLLEKAEPLLEPRSFALEYIGERGEDPLTRSFTVSSAEKESLRRLLKEVWAKVNALDFHPL